MELFNSGLGRNITFKRPAYFTIHGFRGIPNIHYYYVFLFFVYIVSLLGNSAVMAIVCIDHNLRTPKYIAVFNLAFVDLFGSSALVPKVIDIFLFDHHRISYNGCLTFLFFCYACLSMQSLTLVILCYDRLMAITYPLHYQMRVTNRSMLALVASSWLLVISVVLVAVGLLTRLSICKSAVINSYFCDHGQIYRMACNDNRPSRFVADVLVVLLLWVPVASILASYSYIGYALSRVATAQERVKALKTCSAHLSLVAMYFLPILTTFSMKKRIHPNARIINLSLTSILPPMLNPIIYVLQTQEIKQSIKRILRIKKMSKISVKTEIIK